jgi:hypothetical protein
VGRRADTALGVRFVELDAIYHQPGWVELETDEFRRRVREIVEGEDDWVVDGNYSKVTRDIVWGRATQIVWVNPPKWRVMVQVIGRSVMRAIDRKPLWNGNRESITFWVNPEHPIRWAWSTHARRQREYEALMDDRWVVLRSRSDVERFVRGLRPG